MRSVRVAAVVLVGMVALGACSSSTKSAEPAGTTPEQVTTSAAAVAAGLTQIKSIAAQIATQAGTDQAAAKETDAKIEPIWMTIEGTVKANNPDAYISFEDAFSALETAAETGDAAKGSDGSSRVAAAVDAYLVAYPA
jgi:hypothetical protein